MRKREIPLNQTTNIDSAGLPLSTDNFAAISDYDDGDDEGGDHRENKSSHKRRRSFLSSL